MSRKFSRAEIRRARELNLNDYVKNKVKTKSSRLPLAVTEEYLQLKAQEEATFADRDAVRRALNGHPRQRSGVTLPRIQFLEKNEEGSL